MQWIKPGTNYDFMGAAPKAIIGSLSLIVFFIVFSLVVPPKWGIDFAGGTEIQLKVDPGKDIGDVRDALAEAGLSNDSVQRLGDAADHTFQVRVKDVNFGAEQAFASIRSALVEEFGADAFGEFHFDAGDATEVEVATNKPIEPEQVQAALVRRGLLPGAEAPGAGTGAGAEPPVPGVPPEASASAPAAGEDGGEVAAAVDGGSTPAPAGEASPDGSAVAPEGQSINAATPSVVAAADQWVSRSTVDPSALVIRFPGVTQRITEALAESKSMGAGTFEVLKVDTVGPKAGRELREKAILSIVITSLLLLVYIAFRFDMSFAPGAVIATFHDVLIAVGVMLVLQREINLDIVGAALTILGYSVNDTIVTFDRIRENLRRHRRKDLRWIVNRSVNETLSRTILTSLTVMLVVMVLVILGGPILRNMALCLLFGILAGTYSSIFIASPTIIYLSRWFPVEPRAVAAAAANE